MKTAFILAAFLLPVVSYCQPGQMLYNEGKPVQVDKFIQVVDSLKAVKSTWKVCTTENIQRNMGAMKTYTGQFWVDGYKKEVILGTEMTFAKYCFAAPGIFQVDMNKENTSAAIILYKEKATH